MDGKWIWCRRQAHNCCKRNCDLLIRSCDWEREVTCPFEKVKLGISLHHAFFRKSVHTPRKTNNSLLPIVPFCFFSFVYRPFGNTSAQLSIDNVIQRSAHCEIDSNVSTGTDQIKLRRAIYVNFRCEILDCRSFTASLHVFMQSRDKTPKFRSSIAGLTRHATTWRGCIYAN